MMEEKAGWPFFEHACVINLDSRPDRWQKMQAQFARLHISGVERFPAVSLAQCRESPPPPHFRSRALAIALRTGRNDAAFESRLLAAWACLRSHLGVIEHAQRQGWPWVLIMEDDCELEPYARPVLQLAARQAAEQGWDLLYLGGKFKRRGYKTRVARNLYTVNRLLQAHAYVVRSTVYDTILREAPLSGMPIDVYYSEVLLPRIRALLVEPQVAYQRTNELSNIKQGVRRKRFKLRGIAAAFKRRLAALRYGR